MKEEQPNYHVLETNKLRHAMSHCDFETIKTITIDISDDYDRILRFATHTTTEILTWCFERHVKVKNPAYVVSDCAEHGKPECLDYLARKGFDMNAKQADGDYPLYTAAIGGRANNIQVLINHGVEPNDQNALLGAINNGHLEATKTLLENGADPTANNDNALYQAITWGYDEIISYLIVDHKMPIRPETREWLKNENPDHVGVILAKQLIEKRDLFERLNQKPPRAIPTTKEKSQSFKHKI